MRPRTLRALYDAKLDVRAWCFRCARGERVDSIWYMRFADRGWDDSLSAAAVRFRCKVCRRSDEVLLVPATAPPRPKATAGSFVEYWFHNARGERKKGR